MTLIPNDIEAKIESAESKGKVTLQITDQNIKYYKTFSDNLKIVTQTREFKIKMVDNKIVYHYLILISAVTAKVVFIADGPIQMIGSRVYKEELLTNEYQYPKELAYDHENRRLYFMYMDDLIQNSGRAYINVITKETNKIKNIKFNKATAVNRRTGDVYFGSDDGLYKYDPFNNTANNIGLYNMNIMKLVIRNNEMYLLDANNHMIYEVFDEGRRAIRFGNMKTVVDFEVDNKKNVFYYSLCGVFCAKYHGDVIHNKDLSLVYHFIVEKDKVLGVTDDAIYELNCEEGTANKLADFTLIPRSIILGDYGDIYYAKGDNIFWLKPVSSYLVYRINQSRNSTENV